MTEGIYPTYIKLSKNSEIKIALSRDEIYVGVAVYDVNGNIIRYWGNPEEKTIHWNGKDNSGNFISPGVYILYMRSKSGVKAIKFIVVK